jgi:hypothetical protein
MWKKLIIYPIILRKLADKRLLYLLLVPSLLMAKRMVKSSRPSLKRPLAACLLGVATGQMELLRLRLKMMLQS